VEPAQGRGSRRQGTRGRYEFRGGTDLCSTISGSTSQPG
jgi:hypothetical protein